MKNCRAIWPVEYAQCILESGHDGPHLAGNGEQWLVVDGYPECPIPEGVSVFNCRCTLVHVIPDRIDWTARLLEEFGDPSPRLFFELER